MRTYERNGVNVDQCTGCKGVFLDRGELEALINAEADSSESFQPQSTGYRQETQQPRKKKSFLSEFLEFD
jgi:Zn-finger nucleic acid-binding protein